MGYGILNFGKSYNTTLATANVSSQGDLKIYPNPVTSVFSISTTEKIISVELYNTLGQKVQNLKNENTQNIERLNKGVYFVKVKTDKNEYVEKIVKN